MQVVYLLKKVQHQEDLVAAYMEDYKGTGQFIDDSVNELMDIWSFYVTETSTDFNLFAYALQDCSFQACCKYYSV